MMKRCRVVTAVMVLVLGCAGGSVHTLRGWTITETRIESAGRVAGLLCADEVRDQHGLDSPEGLLLARTGRALNASARILATDHLPPQEEWNVVTGFLQEALDVSLDEELLVTEGIALMKELATQVEVSPRARLWLALFVQSASHAILEVYENELISSTDHGDSPGDSMGDRRAGRIAEKEPRGTH